MPSEEADSLVSRIRVLADKNFPKIKDQLSADEQAYVLKTTDGVAISVKVSRNGIQVMEGDDPHPVSTMTMSPQDMDLLLKGQLDGVKAFMMGKIRVQGDVFKTMALNNILKNSQ